MRPEASRVSLSVIVPARNAETFIGSALRSIARQSVKVDEVIAIDDGSSDATSSVIDGFEAPFPVRLLRTEGIGAAAARNRGVEASVGSHLAFLDADDLWLPHKLAAQIAALGLASGSVIVFGHCREFSWPAGAFPIRRERMQAPSLSSMLIAKADFERVGPFREDLKIGELLEWLGRPQAVSMERHFPEDAAFLRRVHANNSTRDIVERRQHYLDLFRSRRRQMAEARPSAP